MIWMVWMVWTVWTVERYQLTQLWIAEPVFNWLIKCQTKSLCELNDFVHVNVSLCKLKAFSMADLKPLVKLMIILIGFLI